MAYPSRSVAMAGRAWLSVATPFSVHGCPAAERSNAMIVLVATPAAGLAAGPALRRPVPAIGVLVVATMNHCG